MAGKTPIPKSQREIQNSLITPYDTARGNPNNISADKRENTQNINPDRANNNISVLNGYEPITTYQTIILPDYVNLTYNCIIYTYYVEQLNHVIESINYAADTYWGNPERFKFRATINSYQTVNELNTGTERMVRGTFDIKMNGYIIPSTVQSDLESAPKISTANKVVFSTETTEALTNKRENRFIENIDTNL
jgi:hypothetical protein